MALVRSLCLVGYFLAAGQVPFPCPLTSGKYKFHTLISLSLSLFLPLSHIYYVSAAAEAANVTIMFLCL